MVYRILTAAALLVALAAPALAEDPAWRIVPEGVKEFCSQSIAKLTVEDARNCLRILEIGGKIAKHLEKQPWNQPEKPCNDILVYKGPGDEPSEIVKRTGPNCATVRY